MTDSKQLVGEVVLPGLAHGPVLKLDIPVSFWGGVDHHGTIIDVHHPQHGLSLTGKVLVMEAGRGSSSSSSVLAELIRTNLGPVAIVLAEADVIIALGAIVGSELYDKQIPIIKLDISALETLTNGEIITVDNLGDRGVIKR